MKIIKMGNIDTYRGVCPYCSCEYEYDDSDIFTNYELTASYAAVICPCCHRPVRVMNRVIPRNPLEGPTVTYTNTVPMSQQEDKED